MPPSSPLPPSETPIPKHDPLEKCGRSEYKQEPETFSKNDGEAQVDLPSPKLRLHIQDLAHKSTHTFLDNISDPNAVLRTALTQIIKYLYTSPPRSFSTRCSQLESNHFEPFLPETRSVTLVLRDFAGVAHTKSIDLDVDHKEIHLSLTYIEHAASLKDPLHELLGVITHELVHCYQHTVPKNGKSAPYPPSGLIEGIADFVRLKAGLAPPHWNRPRRSSDLPKSWDRGYQDTAFFLEWIEDIKSGVGSIGMLNDRLLRSGYTETFWKNLFGAEVGDLWRQYGEYLDRKGQHC